MNKLIHESNLTACGIQTRVFQSGANLKATEAVVFIHGNPGSGADWLDLMVRLAPHGRSVAFDMPGFGRADKPADYPYSVEGGASFIMEALKQLGISRVHLVVHDFGGPWGLMWAALSPLSVVSVTLVNTGVLLDYEWHGFARLWRTPVIGELTQLLTNRTGFKWTLRKGSPRGLSDEFLDRMYDEMDAGTRRAVLRLYRSTNDIHAKAQMLRDLLKPHGWPALVIWGDADPFIPSTMAERQKEVFPNAQVVHLPQSGHFPFADDPDGTAEIMVPFLVSQWRASAQTAGASA